MTSQGHLAENEDELTQRMRIEETLKRMRLMLAFSDTALRYTWIYNPHTDFCRARILGKRDDELQPNATGKALVAAKREALDSGRPIRRSITFPMSGGDHTYDMIFDTLRDGDGKAIGVVSAAIDVTEFAIEDLERRQAQALIKSLFDSTPIGLGVWDRNIRFIRLNQSLATINGLPIAAHIGKRPSEILPEIKDIHQIEEFMRGVMESGKPAMSVEIYGSTPADRDTEHVWREHFYPILLEDEVIGLGAIVEDVTELKQAQESLRQAHDHLESQVAERTAQLSHVNEQLRVTLLEQQRTAQELAEVRRRLAQSREAERLRLAHDLHDTTMQDLTALTYDLVQLNAEHADAELSDAVAAIRRKIGQINQTLRRVVGDLRPPILVDFGIKAAVEAHIERLHNSHPSLEITLDAADNLPSLHETKAILLYRIQQQALRNVLQHAQATHVWVRIANRDNSIQLEIEDNGQGFVIPTRWIELARQGHLGIVSMSERASEAGGVLEIDSEPEKGTVVRVRVPVEEMNDE